MSLRSGPKNSRLAENILPLEASQTAARYARHPPSEAAAASKLPTQTRSWSKTRVSSRVSRSAPGDGTSRYIVQPSRGLARKALYEKVYFRPGHAEQPHQGLEAHLAPLTGRPVPNNSQPNQMRLIATWCAYWLLVDAARACPRAFPVAPRQFDTLAPAPHHSSLHHRREEDLRIIVDLPASLFPGKGYYAFSSSMR